MASQKVSQADQNLWLAYGAELKRQLMNSPTLGEHDRIFIAPLSAAGIAAGQNIPMPIENMGIFNVADALLDPSDPVFMPTRTSYSQRAALYAANVFLNGDKNPGAAVRYQSAQSDLAKYTADYNTVVAAQLANWKTFTANGLTSDPFWTWAATNAPNVNQALLAMNGAAANSANAAAAIGGPDSAMVGQYQNALTTALGNNNVNGFNMSVSPASASQMAAQSNNNSPPASYLAPLYTIDNQYAGLVDGWIATYPQKKDSPIKLSFGAKDASKTSWQNFGYSSDSTTVSGSYCIFFRCSYTENSQIVTKNISSEELDADMTVSLTTTGFGTFKLTPSNKWNPAQLWGMPLISGADASLSSPAAYVSQAVLGYGVGMEISMQASAVQTISQYLQKAQSSSGSASIFGFNIGLGGDASTSQTSTVTFDQVLSASTSSSIKIPPADNAYPTLIAAIGTELPQPSPRPNSS